MLLVYAENLINKEITNELAHHKGTASKEPIREECKYRQYICGEEALRISPTEQYCLHRPIRRGHFNISQHYSMQQVQYLFLILMWNSFLENKRRPWLLMSHTFLAIMFDMTACTSSVIWPSRFIVDILLASQWEIRSLFIYYCCFALVFHGVFKMTVCLFVYFLFFPFYE